MLLTSAWNDARIECLLIENNVNNIDSCSIFNFFLDNHSAIIIIQSGGGMMVAAKKGEVPAIGRFFMEVEIGRYPNIEAIEQAIISSGKSIDYASEVREIGISPVRKKVSLWEVCSIELGFHEKAPRSEIYEKAFDAGLKETTMEAVLLARIGCADKVWRIGGTQPVVYHKHHTCLLSLGSMFGKLFWLSAVNDGGPDYLYGPYRKWLFEK